ncbi:MAG: hypothetical protein M1818_000194 [Claussenomyces sp. TS43310]|nr:MAG: hypothetical protein M1818_000194 [Claussenomyces sp. TS43310]
MRIACLQFAPVLGDVDDNLNRADAVLSKANPKDIDLLVLPELAFSASPEYYSSAVTVNSDGETIANYRKSFLYRTDETWALEGPDGFYDGEVEGLGVVAIGISRLEPVIRAENDGEVTVVIANRCGVEDDAVYAGTSAVLGIENGEVKVYGVLGRGEKELLVVDTDQPPQAKLISTSTLTISHDNSQHPITNSDTPHQMQYDSETETQSANIDEIISVVTPISPVEPMMSHAYFANISRKKDDVQIALGSTVNFPSDHTPQPIDARPTSPKSRNASRTRIPMNHGPALASGDLAHEPPNIAVGLNEKILPPSASEVVSETSWVGYRGLAPHQEEGSMSLRPRSTGW